MSDSNLPESQLLEQLTAELREESEPDLDFEALEARLIAQVEVEQAQRRRRSWIAGGLSLAAAAAAAFLLSRPAPAPPTRPLATLPTPSSNVVTSAKVDGNTLSPQQHVVAQGHGIVVNHAKHSQWTLAPGSDASALQVGSKVVIALHSGSLEAQVVPSQRPETFVVQVKQARVAVHGTKFRVVVKNDGLDVDVSEGVVAVGPADAQPLWFLNAGDKGTFADSGREGSVQRETAELPPAPSEAVAGNSSPRKPVVLPSTPPQAELTALADRAAAVATQCFTQHVNLEAGVRITAKSQMTIALAPNGRVGGVSFEPPLAPQVQACVQSRLGTPKLSPSQKGGQTERTVWLSP
ncbi:MAG: FecR domain-containing protein [Polyangiaceae bacterium]